MMLVGLILILLIKFAEKKLQKKLKQKQQAARNN